VPDDAFEGRTPLRFRPLLVVPDANVLTGFAWTEHLLVEAQRGRVKLYWSPKILEETGRVRLWIWIKRTFRRSQPPTGSSGWKALWTRYSQEAHIWFSRVSPHIHVIDDGEPHEPAWIEPHPDPNDAWLWNAARRINADVVVTVNLRDGPPIDAAGVRTHDGITYIHPAVFMLLLTILGGIFETGRIPDDTVELVQRFMGPGSNFNPSIVAAQLRAILAKIAEESAADQS